jgi:lycopene beta-cyclase
LAIARAGTPGETVKAVREIADSLRGQRRFERLLNRLMFNAMAPDARWTALDRFYRLPDATIKRFYASRNTHWDRMRVLLGRPPRGISWRGLFSDQREKS